MSSKNRRPSKQYEPKQISYPPMIQEIVFTNIPRIDLRVLTTSNLAN